MIYEELLSIAVKLLVALLALAGTHLTIRIKAYLKERISTQELELLDKLIQDFCKAAEQQYKESDIDGLIRLEYVQQLLVEAGYEITDIIKAKIESAVYSINQGG